MPKIVFDTSVLVSAFLKQIEGAASFELLRFSESKAYELFISDDILEETARVLLEALGPGRQVTARQQPQVAQTSFRLSTAARNAVRCVARGSLGPFMNR